MDELLRDLPPEAVVLDLGCGAGSFDSVARLPFPSGCFDVVISNHSLEHVENLSGTLEEIGRALKPIGSLYVAVPDAITITDRLYGWLAHGGGHVNPFSSAHELIVKIEHATGKKHEATRTLCSSLSFLNRRSHRLPRRLLLLGGGTETSLRFWNYFFRLLDRFFGTRLSIYGWALYFGNVNSTIERDTWTNVCIFCGADTHLFGFYIGNW